MPFAALLTAAFVLLWELPGRPRAFLLGITLGLAHLARPVVVPLLPAWILGIALLAPPRRRAVTFGLAAAGFLPIAALTALYKWQATGSPWTDVGGYLLLTGVTPEFVVSRLNRMTPPPDAGAWIAAHNGTWIAKVARNLKSVVYGALWLGGRWPAPVAAVTALAMALRGDTRNRGFAVTFAALAGLLTLLSAATVADPRMLFPLLPAAIALGLGGVTRMLRPFGAFGRALAMVAAAAAVVAGLLPTLVTWESARAGSLEGRSAFHETEWRVLGHSLTQYLPENALVASDAAPWIAWFTRHPVTLVPLHPRQILTGPPRLRPGALVLTNEWLIHRPGEEEWLEVYQSSRPPEGFRFVGRLRTGRLAAIVYERIPPPPPPPPRPPVTPKTITPKAAKPGVAITPRPTMKRDTLHRAAPMPARTTAKHDSLRRAIPHRTPPRRDTLKTATPQ